jgi:glycosyltransferase involved in cell wall biosynthesis
MPTLQVIEQGCSMAKFILVDHSLYGVGGHHYAYAVNVLRAAEAMGHQIVVATHVDFRAPDELPKSWQLLPVFTRDAYRGFSVFNGNEQSLRSMTSLHPESRTWGKRTRDWFQTTFDWRNLSRTHRRRVRQYRKHLRQSPKVLEEFARECEQVFEAVAVGGDDAVFVPTLTEFDLKWLALLLHRRPDLLVAPWHLQFHFNFLEGREPDYAAQAEQFAAMQRHFASQLNQIPGHRVFFYTTTRQLSAQYESLGMGTFQPLPYPVKAPIAMRPETPLRSQINKPLRLTCGGCVRPEKGYEWLSSAIAELWNDYFATSRVQLLIQTDAEDLSLSPPAHQRPRFVDRVAQVETADTPIVCVRGPLPAEEYARLIQCADIGLFLYDSERYYTRCSGVLLEMLSAGVPVIVPAGCWLSAQIAEQIYAHLDGVIADVPSVDRLSVAQMLWQRATRANEPMSRSDTHPAPKFESTAAALAFGGAARGLTCTIPIPAAATDLGLTLSWTDSPPPGVYVRLVTRQFDKAGNPVQAFSTILEQRTDNNATPALIHLKRGATRLELTLENAFHHGVIELADIESCFLSAAGRRCPAGAVGLIAADRGQLPELLADMTQNYAHYRSTAMVFAKQVTWNHRPERTIAMLRSKQELGSKFAPEVKRYSKAA